MWFSWVADEISSCLKNVVAMFHVLEKELEWRKARSQLEGFETMKSFKPLVAVGAAHSLEDELLMADYFRKSLMQRYCVFVTNVAKDGVDGLGGVHTSVSFDHMPIFLQDID